mmetsp:Transcript_36741/g.84585  ORF Transcript_36741/g.84585 Transcript_36741/m.84585 type:complete len:255 (+) Transcript_36741:76-840(+)
MRAALGLRAALILLSVVAVKLLAPGCAFIGALAPHPLRSTRTAVYAGAGYLERNPRKATDAAFDASKSAANQRVEVEFKERPFGILRYQPGSDGKGAMAMEIVPEARYPGDPLAQAALGGVTSGMVVTGIDGVDMRSVDFDKIMDLLDDEAADISYRPNKAMNGIRSVFKNGKKAVTTELPLTVWFANIPGYKYTGGKLHLDKKEGWLVDEDKGAAAAGLISRLSPEQLSRLSGVLSDQVLASIKKYAQQMNKV